MSLYLCVDCGGTKTSAVICDASGVIVGRGSGGPSNITYLTPEAFISSVKEAIGDALKTSSASSISLPPVTQSPFAAAWFGISGADSPAAIAKISSPLSNLLGLPIGPKLAIANDTHLLAAPVRMYSDVTAAVAVVAGTGSIVVGFREIDGKVEELGRAGGWGWILGDEGGGFDVGRETLRQIFLEHDKALATGKPVPQNILIDRILERFGVENIMEILTGVYQPDPSPTASVAPGEEMAHHNLPRERRISSLSPLVFETAFEHNDSFALNILKTSAAHLTDQIVILLGRGAQVVPPSESIISFGGSLVGVEKYRNLIVDELSRRGHVFKRVIFVEDVAAVGARGLAAASNLQQA